MTFLLTAVAAERLASRTDKEIATIFSGGYGSDKQRQALVDLEIVLSATLKKKFSFSKELFRSN